MIYCEEIQFKKNTYTHLSDRKFKPLGLEVAII